jgi:hypothetical protein
MDQRWMFVVAATLLWGGPSMTAQRPCNDGFHVEGVVSDPTGALIPGAHVFVSGSVQTTTDAEGYYKLPCVARDGGRITVEAESFAAMTKRARGGTHALVRLDFQLEVAHVDTNVTVGADSSGVDSNRGPGTTTLNAEEVNRLPDDPDDLIRQLQVLSASSGGDPSGARIVVDGFQNGSAMPPKSSIASIRINPDIFAPEYENPAWNGGRIEITTKTGADQFHGALFLTDSDGSFNALNPFSVASAPIGKRRYGFELSGPLRPKKLDFAAALEKREIDEYNVVNATTLDSGGNQVAFRQSVKAPERLWIASARTDWQVNSKDVATLSYAANVNNLGNQGVGGLVLSEAGYNALVGEYDLRLHNALTISSNLLHDTRIGISWKHSQRSPLSTAPAIQVPGYFTGGGATSQQLDNRERDIELDHEVLFVYRQHQIKFGVQALGILVHAYDPDTFNGAYLFGGGSAPALDSNNQPTGGTTYLRPIDQYRRAVLNLAGGSPTTYQLTTGTALVPFSQWRVGFYIQDNAKLASHLSVGAGIRYEMQTNPASFAGLNPRLGISWAPDKKESWVFHARIGLFNEPINLVPLTAIERLNGVRQSQITVYSPSFSNPLAPTSGAARVGTVNQFAPSYGLSQNLQLSAVVEHDFPHKWHATASYNFGGNWQETQAVNINAPIVASSVGTAPDPIAAVMSPRPIQANENIIRYQQSGHSRGNFYLASLDQHSYKRFGFHLQYWYLHFRENPLMPQSSYNSKGESARPDWMRHGGVAWVGNALLPFNVDFATQFTAMPGRPFNITTGTDANGDGNFNDRPSYASGNGSNVYNTRYGLLTTNAVNGNVPYNAGTMPAVLYLSANLSRTFTLNPKDKEHPRSLTFNARSSNLLNHTNVSNVNTVLSSGSVGNPVSAETARRVEMGLRFSF